MKEHMEEVTKNMVSQKDEIISTEITKLVGEGWTMADVKNKGVLKRMPDGTEVFAFDGVDLIQFYDVEFETKTEDFKMLMTAKQRYRLLSA